MIEKINYNEQLILNKVRRHFKGPNPKVYYLITI